MGATPNKNIAGPVGQPGETHASRGPLGGLTIAFLAPKKIVRAAVRKNGTNLNQWPLAGTAAGGAPSKKNIAGQGFTQVLPIGHCHLGGPSGGLSPPLNLPGVGQKGPIKIAPPGAFFCRPDRFSQALPAVSRAGGATAFHAGLPVV